MNRVAGFATCLILAESMAWGATLSWDANNEPDLAGYRVYQCSQQPCGPASGSATLLATLGKVTSLNIGTPAVVQYYVVTAYDFANNESGQSNVTTYIPPGGSVPVPPPPPAPTPPPPTVPAPAIGANPLTLRFTAQQGGGNPAPQTLGIGNSGGGTLSWNAGENSPWLALSPASGTGNGTISVSITTGTRTAGTYSGSITLSATGASTVTIPVTLTISPPPGLPPAAPPPAPSGLRLTAVN